jgi:hypothetical protein
VRPSRVATLLWLTLILVLVIVEVLEISHVFRLPVGDWIGDPLALVFALVLVTILALVGAIFIGIYFTNRVLSPSGFTPFEEEMLKMRGDLAEVKETVRQLSEASGTAVPPAKDPPAPEGRP